jgi:hypothetical protein
MPGNQFLDLTRNMSKIATDLGGRCETVKESSLKAAGLVLEIGKKAGPEIGAQLATISEVMANIAVFLGEIGESWRNTSGAWNELSEAVEKAAKK